MKPKLTSKVDENESHNLRKLMSVESEDEIKVRAKRNARLPLQYSGGRSPLPVTYCVNYNQQEHADWVKPLFSSIVYRLSVT